MNIDTVKKLLANQERTELYSIISKLSNYSEDAEEWLLDYCSKKGKKSDSSLIVEKQIQHYWSVAEDIIDDANMYGGTYNEDDAYDALDKIDELAKKNNISSAKLCLKYAADLGTIPLPRSRSKNHMEDKIRLKYIVRKFFMD